MAAKRVAGRELNHDNWDQEDEPEDAGVFKQADENELKSRVIKKAKRRAVVSNEDGPGTTVFKGFAGFGMPVGDKPAFTFNKSSTEPAVGGFKFSTSSSQVTSNLSSAANKFAGFGSLSASANHSTDAKTSDSAGVKPCPVSDSDSADTNKSKFLGALKVLNESVLKWLSSHMDKNPYCYFTPVLNDYETHLKSIKSKYNIKDTDLTFDKNGDASPPGEVVTPTNIQLSKVQGAAPTSTGSPAPTFSFGTTQKVTPPPTSHSEPSPSKGSQTRSSMFSSTSMSASAKPDTSPVAKMPLFSFGSKPSESSAAPVTTSSTSTTEQPKPLFSFGSNASATPKSDDEKPAVVSDPKPASGGFNFFGAKPSEATSNSASTGFKLGSFGAPTAGGFTFGASSGATAPASGFFKPPAAGSGATGSTAEDDEEYVPPKAEVENKITEDDALYSKRVKLFYQKDEKYVDRGVGNLFIKPLDTGKKSLLIRADTNLDVEVEELVDGVEFSFIERSTVLLNILLQESIPFKRVGKNNVQMICIPNPPIDPKAEPNKTSVMLIRVKSEEDADELCNKLNEYKK